MAYLDDYAQTVWTDNAAPSINADNLNNMEGGIKNASKRTAELSVIAENLKESIDYLAKLVTQANGGAEGYMM